MRYVIAVRRTKAVIASLCAVMFYLSTFMIFPHSVFPDEMLGVFYVGSFFILVLHEIVHAVAAVLSGIPAKDVCIGFEFEYGSAWCKFKGSIARNRLMFFVIAPLVFITVIGTVSFVFTRQHMFLILVWVNFSVSMFDILFFLDFVRMPRDVIFNELADSHDTELRPPRGFAKNLGVLLAKSSGTAELPIDRFSFFTEIDPRELRAAEPRKLLSVLNGHVRLSRISVLFFVVTLVEVVFIVTSAR